MKTLKYLIIVGFLSLSFSSFAQKQVEKREKQLKAQEKEKKKAADDSVNEGKERHLNIQTKKTKKRKKKNAKRNKKMHKKRAKARKK